MNANQENEKELKVDYKAEKLLNRFNTEINQNSDKFTEIIPDSIFSQFLEESLSSGVWTNIEPAQFILSSFSLKENIATFDSLINSSFFSSIIISTESKEIQQILVNIFIKLCKNNPEKYVSDSIILIYSGIDQNLLNIINYGIVSLHKIINHLNSIPNECLTEDFRQRIVYLFNEMTRPFLLTNILELMNDLLVKQIEEFPLDLFNLNRIISLCAINNANVQVKALKLLFTYLNMLPVIENPQNLLELMTDIILKAAFPSKVFAMKCFYVLIEFNKEISLNIIREHLIDTLVDFIHSYNDAGITAMSILLRVMQICENDEQLSLEFASILSTESCIEALQNVIENNKSVMAQQAQLILSFIDKLEES